MASQRLRETRVAEVGHGKDTSTHKRPPSSANHPVMELQRRIGNQAVQLLLHSGTLGTGRPFDRRAANTVTRSNDDLAQRIRTAGTGGGHLDTAVQRRLETGLGADLSNVRVHTDRQADRLARSVSSIAFTVGSHIFFRAGKYNPSSQSGMHLLAHEAVHTIQQASGPAAGTPVPGGMSISSPTDSFERFADSAADSAVRHSDTRTQTSTAAHVWEGAQGGDDLAMARTLQRQSDSLDQETDQTASQCGVRTVQLPSPGTSTNYVVLKSGPEVAQGIVFITNVGKCQVFIHGGDSSGRPLDPTNPLILDPGEYAFQFVPPPESAVILAVTSDQCRDYSAISYDPCTGIV